jgi:geranylgeranyl diphosphate synthase type I
MTQDIFRYYVPLIEEEMRQVLASDDGYLAGHYGMLQYHMGWMDQQLRPTQIDGGKRIRPVLCLLSSQAVGGTIERALPAAASLELLHNFSLIHDDIEDDSPTRRHRPTVWAIWGRPQAINAGDAMFALSRKALYGLLERGVQADVVLRAMAWYDETCLRLTEGQYLDMSFEGRLDVTSDEYLTMIGGKTAALLDASLRIGAIVGGASASTADCLGQFGRAVGLTFQIQDDILGIWGEEALTGKSAQSDILTRKKSLPIVYGLEHPLMGQALRELYRRPVQPADVPAVLALLDGADARTHAEEMAQEQHRRALADLRDSGVLVDGNEAGQALVQVAEALLNRRR